MFHTGSTFRERVEYWLWHVGDRNKDILEARLALPRKERSTLQQLADELGVTRERIRQLQKQSLHKAGELGLKDFIDPIEATVGRLGGAAPVSLVEVSEESLAGLTEYLWVIDALLDLEPTSSIGRFQYRWSEYIVGCSTDAWHKRLKEAEEAALELVASVDYPELETVEAVIRARFPLGWERATGIAIDSILDDAIRAYLPDTTRPVIIALTKSVYAAIKAILVESYEPLHFTDIHERVSRQFDLKRNVGYVHNVCADAEDIHLLGRGTYGISKHVRIPERQQLTIAREVDQLVNGSQLERQWHSSELLDVLFDTVPSLSEDITPYELAFVIATRCPNVRQLGRMVFQSSNATETARIDLHQAVVSVLKHAGRPMTDDEIVREIEMHRGVSRYGSIILPSADYARLASGKVGLVHRDFGLEPNRSDDYLARVLTECERCGYGLTRNEIARLFDVDYSKVPDFGAGIVALARADHRFSISISNYIYPSEWPGPNRLAIMEAVQNLAGTRPDGWWTLEEIWDEVRRSTKRFDYPIETLSNRLSAVPYVTYDPQRRQWMILSD